jgi:hypothetical protein
MRCHIQCSGIHRVLDSIGGFSAFCLENVVNFLFDIQQLSLCIRLPDPAPQGIERIQRAFRSRGPPILRNLQAAASTVAAPPSIIGIK